MIHQDEELSALIEQAEASIEQDSQRERQILNQRLLPDADPDLIQKNNEAHRRVATRAATEWMAQFQLSREEIEAMEDAEHIIQDLAIRSQLSIVAAKPGHGKTTLLMNECGHIADDGYTVAYVNMDCGAADLKYWHKLAEAGGFQMVTPHFKGARGIEEWLQGLAVLASCDYDLSRLVIVVDTLKKIADLMNKARAKSAMHLLRTLTARSCTVICAAHVNKHRDADGLLVFEGVGDIEADCDNLIYLESQKDDSGIRTITSRPSDKVRGIFRPRSWRILPDRTVEPLCEPVDVAASIEAASRLERDATVIDIIVSGIEASHHKRGDLYDFCVNEHNISKRDFDSVLRRYTLGKTPAKLAPRWRNEKQKANNADYYILLENH